MNQYYNKKGKRLGTAWSVSPCDKLDDHEPHRHNPEFALYGPYFCPGSPIRKIYNTPKRRPVN